MRFHVVTGLLALASTASAAITWTLQKAANPTSDQADAYFKIEAAMKAAVAHYAKFSDATKRLTVQYEVSLCSRRLCGGGLREPKEDIEKRFSLV